ncbi:MAG TPA: SGNH/GDSL hydrolase family protein [Acidobacteriaceae bacterium]|nr:SGNH/GDSL hydrolase family protein [Acidobacteriaceae bacterium]
MHRLFAPAAALLLALACTPALLAQNSPRWIGTWAASPMGSAVNFGQPSPANTTYRNLVRISAGGTTVRVELTNEFGARPLTIGAAHVALSAGAGAIQPATDHALTFNGQPSVIIPPGAPMFSDPIPMQVPALASLDVSIYLPDQSIGETTCHQEGMTTTWITEGDNTAAAAVTNARTISSFCFVKAIDVTAADANSATIVCLGDSITDGAHSTPSTNRRWPDILAARLQADPKTAHLFVLNEGIGGNRLLNDIAGPNALARFNRDVLAQSGVKYVILLEGINDIGHTTEPRSPADLVTVQQMILAGTQIVTEAHAHGLKIYGATLTPYVGARYASPKGEEMREAFNQWIRTSGLFDGVIDFDKAVQDPANPTAFAPAYDSGDHLHPNDAGYAKMGDSIDLKLFQ